MQKRPPLAQMPEAGVLHFERFGSGRGNPGGGRQPRQPETPTILYTLPPLPPLPGLREIRESGGPWRRVVIPEIPRYSGR